MPRNRELPTARVRRPAMNAINAILGAYWAMEEQTIRTMLEIASRENLSPEAVAAQLGRPLDNTHAVTVREGVALIPVTGPLFRYADFFTEISGATTYDQLATDLARSVDDRQVRAIMLVIDSPGGEANGLSQLAAMISDASNTKPVVAYISGTGASAAYWLASAAEAVIVSDLAIVGSIGVRATYRDTKAIDDARGIKTIEIVSSQSPNKRMDPTEDVGRAALQQVMDDLAQVFVDSVAANRGVTPETVLADFGQGGVFVGQAAVDAGLADDVGTFEETFAALRDGGESAVAAWSGGQQSAGAASGSTGRTRAGIPAVPAAALPSTSETTMKEADKTAAAAASASAAATTEGTLPAAAPAATTTVTDPAAGVTSIDAAAVRKAERERIGAIRTLGKGADAALVEKCIEEGLSAEASARVFLESQQQSASARLALLRGDEAAAPAPGASAGSGEELTARQAAKQATASYYAHSTPSKSAK